MRQRSCKGNAVRWLYGRAPLTEGDFYPGLRHPQDWKNRMTHMAEENPRVYLRDEIAALKAQILLLCDVSGPARSSDHYVAKLRKIAGIASKL